MKKIIFSLALLTFICFNIGVFASESGSIQTDCIIKKKLKTPNKKLPSFDFEYTNSEVEESFKKYAGKKTKKLIYKTIERDIERLKKKKKT